MDTSLNSAETATSPQAEESCRKLPPLSLKDIKALEDFSLLDLVIFLRYLEKYTETEFKITVGEPYVMSLDVDGITAKLGSYSRLTPFFQDFKNFMMETIE